jgi:hypothetical protein
MRGSIMKNLFAMAIIATAIFLPAAADAGERVNDMALGAASGALFGGPIGLVAGGVIGYVAGPDISRGFGSNRHHSNLNRAIPTTNDARPLQDVPPDAR